jgi:hypothetical protein
MSLLSEGEEIGATGEAKFYSAEIISQLGFEDINKLRMYGFRGEHT